MAYALASSAGRNVSLQRRTRGRGDALDSARGILAWTLISTLVFWLPLGVALLR
jgi:hypothetical protein